MNVAIMRKLLNISNGFCDRILENVRALSPDVLAEQEVGIPISL